MIYLLYVYLIVMYILGIIVGTLVINDNDRKDIWYDSMIILFSPITMPFIILSAINKGIEQRKIGLRK